MIFDLHSLTLLKCLIFSKFVYQIHLNQHLKFIESYLILKIFNQNPSHGLKNKYKVHKNNDDEKNMTTVVENKLQVHLNWKTFFLFSFSLSHPLTSMLILMNLFIWICIAEQLQSRSLLYPHSSLAYGKLAGKYSFIPYFIQAIFLLLNKGTFFFILQEERCKKIGVFLLSLFCIKTV